MAYILYLHFPPSGITTATAYMSKKAAKLRVTELLPHESGLVWRLMDFSARGGWCDGNTTATLETLSDKPIYYGGETWS